MLPAAAPGGMALVATSCALGLLLAARVAARNRDWRTDVALYSQTLKVSPRATNIRENLGVVAWNHGRIDEAEKQWSMALKLNPNSPITLTNLGLVYAKRKEYQKAEHYFREAMLHKPDYTDPHLNLGKLDDGLGPLAGSGMAVARRRGPFAADSQLPQQAREVVS